MSVSEQYEMQLAARRSSKVSEMVDQLLESIAIDINSGTIPYKAEIAGGLKVYDDDGTVIVFVAPTCRHGTVAIDGDPEQEIDVVMCGDNPELLEDDIDVLERQIANAIVNYEFRDKK